MCEIQVVSLLFFKAYHGKLIYKNNLLKWKAEAEKESIFSAEVSYKHKKLLLISMSGGRLSTSKAEGKKSCQ